LGSARTDGEDAVPANSEADDLGDRRAVEPFRGTSVDDSVSTVTPAALTAEGTGSRDAGSRCGGVSSPLGTAARRFSDAHDDMRRMAGDTLCGVGIACGVGRGTGEFDGTAVMAMDRRRGF
jgi:hypothetical protein